MLQPCPADTSCFVNAHLTKRPTKRSGAPHSVSAQQPVRSISNLAGPCLLALIHLQFQFPTWQLAALTLGFYRAWPISTAGSLSCPPVSRGMEITMFSMATCSLTHPDTSQPDHRLFGLLPGEGWKLRGLSISQSLQAQALLCFAC